MVIRMKASLAEEEVSIVKESLRRERALSEAKVNLIRERADRQNKGGVSLLISDYFREVERRIEETNNQKRRGLLRF
jgi:hypothetical protein